ncbi:MAG: 50S ribosomal protein L31 [Alphaproteobacteria bacterium]
MKPDIHPDYHEIVVIQTDGTELRMRSTYGKPGEVLRLDIDTKTHPAWTGSNKVISRGGQMEKFSRRFGALGLKKD